jgi:dTDP-glucose 4,6-dehydratase
MKLLVTGGAGFIGSNFVRHALERWPDSHVVVLDKLTYAGSLDNLAGALDDPRFSFVHGDICDPALVHSALAGCDLLLNFAAETHVDRSIQSSGDFVRTDVEGTRTLLDAALECGVRRYVQISTDEVYGDMPEGKRATEESPLRPRSPYSASKSGGDLMVQAYHVTYGLDAIITRCSNNYGPYQFPEKLIPLFITNAFQGAALPVYGDGLQYRDWIYVDDHCRALALIVEKGAPGESYNVGTEVERPNIEVVEEIVRLTGADRSTVTYVDDRAGHDRRYALNCKKLRNLGWQPETAFAAGLAATVDWYRSNERWWRSARDGTFQQFYELQYGNRLQKASS